MHLGGRQSMSSSTLSPTMGAPEPAITPPIRNPGARHAVTPAPPWQPASALALLLGGMAGLAALQFAPRLLRPVEIAALLMGLTLACAVARTLRRQPLRLGLLALAALCVGLLWADLRASLRLEEQLDPSAIGQDRWVVAEVAGLPQSLAGYGGLAGWRLLLTLEAQPGLPRTVSVSWFPGPGRGQAPRAGETWRLQLRLKPVHALQNPGLPDAELWLLERGIRAQGSVRAGERLASAPFWHLQALRERVRLALERQAIEPRARAVLAGLAVGDQAALPARDWALLRDSGVVHLFSISGLHITWFAWMAAGAVGLLWRRSAWLCQRWPAADAARWLGLAAAFAYALLAGWGVPAQRTVGLLWVLALLQSSARIWPWPLALALAGALIGLADPWAMVTPGFWLSFVAVALLMHAAPTADTAETADDTPQTWQQRWTLRARQLLQVQLLVSFGLAPLSLLFFGQVSLVGFVANLVAVPLVGGLLAPLALAGVLLPPLWQLAAWGVDGLFALLNLAVQLPAAVWWSAQAPATLQALALLGGVLLGLRLPRGWRLAGGLALLPLGLYSPARPEPGQFRLTVIDVGQGSAIWLQTARHDLLFDAGPRWGGDSDAGARVVLPLLRAQGVRRLDALVISHDDGDHSGGAASLLAALDVKERWGSLPARHALQPLKPCVAGSSWDWDGVRLQWLHPPPGQPARQDNAASCVLRVQAAGQGHAALLTADIEAAQEQALLASGQALRATVLLVPHHGSKTSSSTEFLSAVAPQWALAQAGYRNRHGHPADAVRSRYAAAGVPLLSSAECGAWQWRSQTPPSAAGCWRQQRRRYWLAAPPAVEAADPDALPASDG